MTLALITIPHRGNSQALYEANYRRFMEWVPGLSFLRTICMSRDWDPYYRIQFSVNEQTPYSTMVELRLCTIEAVPVAAARFTIRVYHDAKVAEVISYQGHKNLRPFYDVPNERMYHRDEKRQVNRLLFEFLNLCLRRNIYLDFNTASTEANR
jgi:uncharacterized protein YqiB (DUF1249 family)